MALAAACHAPLHAQVFIGDGASTASLVLSNFQSIEAPRLLIPAPYAPIDFPGAGRTESPVRADPPAPMLQLPVSTPELRHVIDEIALQVGISADLLHAVIAVESRYNNRAVSSRGAIGLMQLLPATARRFGAQDPYVPRENVLAGAKYLKWLMGLFQDDLELALAAYNAGEQAVIRAGGRIPPFAETQAYVPKVLAYLRCASSAACRPA